MPQREKSLEEEFGIKNLSREEKKNWQEIDKARVKRLPKYQEESRKQRLRALEHSKQLLIG